jgi:hypothetical protein
MNLSEEQGDLGSHSEAHSLEVTKYNLKPRAKGSTTFPGGVEGGLGFLEEKDTKTTKRKKIIYVSG